jgi:hypothetical protein
VSERELDDSGPALGRRRHTVLWLAIGIGLLMLALVFRVRSNTLGLALLYLGVTALLLAVVHRWRRPKPFLILALSSLVGYPVLVVLHNFFYAIASFNTEVPPLRWPAEFLHVACFLGAMLLCPAGLVIGLLGAVVSAVAFRRREA